LERFDYLYYLHLQVLAFVFCLFHDLLAKQLAKLLEKLKREDKIELKGQ